MRKDKLCAEACIEKVKNTVRGYRYYPDKFEREFGCSIREVDEAVIERAGLELLTIWQVMADRSIITVKRALWLATGGQNGRNIHSGERIPKKVRRAKAG